MGQLIEQIFDTNVEYERMYHGEDSYKNHDKSLANDLYISAWGSDQHDIVSWS